MVYKFAQVWSASSHAKHNPPSDFFWTEQAKWGTGPECTTILCRPNGQVNFAIFHKFLYFVHDF